MNKKNLARSGKQLAGTMLFKLRKRFVERNLDPRRDSVIICWATYSPWLLDEGFKTVFSEIQGYTLVDLYRCYELWHLVSQTRFLPGDILEVGAWRGGTGCLLARRASELELEATVHLCDTFQGVVKAGVEDQYSGGEHADTSTATVERLVREMGLVNVTIHQGVFPEETGTQLADRVFRLCHIDVDVYQSGKDVMDWVWPRMRAGGIVVFDDFGFASCKGITQLVHELEALPDRICVQNVNGHAIFIKIK